LNKDWFMFILFGISIHILFLVLLLEKITRI